MNIDGLFLQGNVDLGYIGLQFSQNSVNSIGTPLAGHDDIEVVMTFRHDL